MHIHVTAVHALGTFQGELQTEEGATREDLQEVVDGLATHVNNIELLVLRVGAKKIALSKNILSQSVLTLELVE